MKEYDYITIGTGSGLALVDAILQENENVKIAVIDKDEPGGICLTRACIPSKILLYSAELVRLFEKSSEFGINVENMTPDFSRVMRRMRNLFGEDMANIRKSLENSVSIDYYHRAAEFTAPYTLRAAQKRSPLKQYSSAPARNLRFPLLKASIRFIMRPPIPFLHSIPARRALPSWEVGILQLNMVISSLRWVPV